MGTPTQIVTTAQVVEQARLFGLTHEAPVFVGGAVYLEVLLTAIPGIVWATDLMPEKGLFSQRQWLRQNKGRTAFTP
jgi:hypothetical protein